MFVIPIPLLVKAQLKRRRKIVLIGVMSLGFFTIVAAILNKYFNFASPLTTQYQLWYIREASTAIYVANLMCWWPLLRKLFGLKAFQYNSNRGQRGGNENNQHKDDSGYYSNASQSMPSFSFRSWRPPCRRGIHGVQPGRHNAQRTSTEAINRSDNRFMSDMHRVEAVPLESWNRKEDPIIETSTTQDPFSSFDQGPNPHELHQDMMHSDCDYGAQIDTKRHTCSPC